MMNYEILTERFQKVVNELKIKKIVKSEAEIAEALDMTPQGVYSMKSGRTKISMKTIQLLYDKFQINPKYFFELKSSMWEDQYPDYVKYNEEGRLSIELKEEEAHLDKPYTSGRIKQLKNQLRDKDLIIQLLQEKIEKYEADN